MLYDKLTGALEPKESESTIETRVVIFQEENYTDVAFPKGFCRQPVDMLVLPRKLLPSS